MQPVIAPRRVLLMAALAAGCGDPPAHVRLVPVPVEGSSCGRPAGANALALTAFSPAREVTRAVPLDEAVDLADLPDDTVQLGLEVVIGGGVIGSAGKTAPLAFGELVDGAEIPIRMIPPGGFCPAGTLGEPRLQPLVARAGDGALVVGGLGPTGPASTAEFYDPRTGTFTPVAVPDALVDPVNGMAGSVLAPLPDGRVVLTGGTRGLLAVFDPVTRTFGATFALAPQRAFHGAIATDATHVLVAGGCHGVVSAGCDPTPLRSTFVYDLQGEDPVAGPNLSADALAEGAGLFDVGNGFVLAGGFGAPGEAQRFALGDADAVKLTGLAAQVTGLDGGALLTAFDRDAAPAGGLVAVVTPDAAVVPTTNAPKLAGARLASLEDGTVLAVGGDPAEVDGVGSVARYNPTSDRWDQAQPTATAGSSAAGDQPGALVAASLVRLADGSVLVLGGEASPSARAWVYRPSLVGPASGSITVLPATDTSTGVLTAPDPRTVTRGAEWLLTSPDDTLAARALVGGPRLVRGSIKVTVTVATGGLALIAQQVAPGRALVAHLVTGEPARLEQLGSGTVCTGSIVTLPGPATATVATLAITDRVTVRVDGEVVLACDHAATTAGAWGVAASGVGARIAVATVTVAR
jgi:hypothetical protein